MKFEPKMYNSYSAIACICSARSCCRHSVCQSVRPSVKRVHCDRTK